MQMLLFGTRLRHTQFGIQVLFALACDIVAESPKNAFHFRLDYLQGPDDLCNSLPGDGLKATGLKDSNNGVIQLFLLFGR